MACLQALVAATRTPGLISTLFTAALGEHERALGGRQAELVTIPELVDAAGSALDALKRIAGGLAVNVERMQANLESLHGLGSRGWLACSRVTPIAPVPRPSSTSGPRSPSGSTDISGTSRSLPGHR